MSKREFKVGDKVYSRIHGKGIVEEVNLFYECGVIVSFKNRQISCDFNFDGTHNLHPKYNLRKLIKRFKTII